MALVDGRYLVKREIARGGMGIVFEAEHTWLGARIALKTLNASVLERRDVRARLMREARALYMVRHPGVVAVLDAGTCADHGPFVALELFEGRSLDSLIVARQRLDVANVVQLAVQLGATLSYIHTRGVVHRDVKPANVLIGHEPGREGDVARLLDFGIATIPDASDVVDRKLTIAGEVVGTLEYMSPEQLSGGSAVTPAFDIYGLGVLLYECLLGDFPYVGDAVAVLTAMVNRVPIRSIRETRPEVPAALEAAILKALRFEPSERFATAAGLAAACAAAAPNGPAKLALLDVPREQGVTRREWMRAPYLTLASIVGKSGRSIDARTEDISEGGVLLVTAAKWDDGEAVTLRMPLPRSGLVVTIVGIARWQRSNRGSRAMGIEFTQLPDRAREDIRTYVAMMAGASGAGLTELDPAR